MLLSALSTDLYELTMIGGYYVKGVSGRATFDLFVRQLPPTRNYLVAAGLEQALDFLESLRFTRDEIDYLRTLPALASLPREFFDEYLNAAASDPEGHSADAIVPSPLMPHLMYQWLVRRARLAWPGRVVESRPVEEPLGTPYDRLAADGTRYVSFADWTCPIHCIEPSTCPVIDGPRTWEMSDALDDLVRRLNRSRRAAGPVLFVCRHRVYGVGMFDAGAALAGARLLGDAAAGGEPVDVVVGTVSACHGALSVLHLGARD